MSVPTEPLDDDSRQWAPDFKSDPLWDATTRVLKAALLYAGDVQFAGWSSGEWIAGWNVGTWSARFLSKETAWDRFDHAQWHARQARLIRAANEPPKSGWSNDIQVPVIRAGASWRWWRDPESQLHATWHGALASSLLLGALDAYPDAAMDVILDFRERIATARTHPRAAMAAATSGLAHDGEPPSPQALAELRLREVDPAVAILRDEIDALGSNARC